MNGTQASTTTNGDTATQSSTRPTTQTTATTNGTSAAATQEEESSAYRPDSMRLMHLFLASHNVQSYDERVPLMLLDFCHRYTTAVLQDSLLYSDAASSNGTLTEESLQMAVASRVNHQFANKLPQAFNLAIADERNRVNLPPVPKEFGIRLPPEKHCLTGISWNLDEEELIVEEDEDEDEKMDDA